MTPTPYSGFDTMPIDGVWRAGTSGKTSRDTNPYNNELLQEIPLAGIADLDKAMLSARANQMEWELTPAADKAAVLYRAAAIFDRRREEIVDWLIRESGSTRIKAELEWTFSKNIILESASFPSRLHGRLIAADSSGQESRMYRRAIGVVAIISPWNFPLHLSVRSIAPALATGNAVVHKPASDTPVTGGLLIAKIFEEAGLPPGIFNVVVGAGSDIGDAIVQHPIPGLVSFTGSSPVGKRMASLVAESPVLKRTALELGGNSPFVVLDDADVGKAVNAAIFGKFLHQGQICMSINRIIVDAKLYDEFVDRFTRRAEMLRCGDPADPATAIGPVINRQQADKMEAIVKKARAEGARETLTGRIDGLMVRPYVFADVRPQFSLAMDETFGPIAGIIRAWSEEEALEVANATNYGLSSAVFTGNPDRGARFAQKVEAGMTHVNDIPVADGVNVPFGGEKNSGIGRFNGDWVLEEMTTPHWITVQEEPKRYPF